VDYFFGIILYTRQLAGPSVDNLFQILHISTFKLFLKCTAEFKTKFGADHPPRFNQ